MTPPVAAIVLAAGHSKRMGRPKPFLPYQGTTFIAAILGKLRDAGFSSLIVVANPAHSEQFDANPLSDVRLVYNPNVDAGMLSSLQQGVRQVDSSASHAVFCLVDMPEIQAETLRSVFLACRENPKHLIVATFDGRWAHPVGIPRELFDALLSYNGPNGPRGFIETHLSRVVEVDQTDPATRVDVDTPAEFEALRRRENDFAQ
ncbi:nucleotidyltransferase family protein [bacterium]|nr:nucleotidyltransferase family protein [bacterium]